MQRSLKNITTILTAALLTLASPSLALAQGTSVVTIQNPSTFNSLEDILNFFLGLIPGIVVLIFIAILMYGGFVYLTAQDNDEKVASAKKILVAAIVGFILIVLAPVIAQFAGALLGVDSSLFSFL